MAKPPSLPAPKRLDRVTIKRARSLYAGRQTTSAATYDGDKTIEPRRRSRAHRAMSFRDWARNEYGSRARDDLSPKLAQIVHGPV